MEIPRFLEADFSYGQKPGASAVTKKKREIILSA